MCLRFPQVQDFCQDLNLIVVQYDSHLGAEMQGQVVIASRRWLIRMVHANVETYEAEAAHGTTGACGCVFPLSVVTVAKVAAGDNAATT